MATMHAQSQSPFFRLPGEIREKIQRLCIMCREDIDFENLSPTEYPEVLFRPSSHETPSLPAIMSTCKKMHSEMSPFAFTELIVHEQHHLNSRISLICHGHLRWERILRISLIVGSAHRDMTSPLWSRFLGDILKRSCNIEHLDLELNKNEFRQELEEAIAMEERAQRDGSLNGENAELTSEAYSQPSWLEGISRQSSLRRVCFDGGVPTVWLERLCLLSAGRIRVFNDGVRFREAEKPRARTLNGEAGDLMSARTDLHSASTVERPANVVPTSLGFQLLVEPAVRFD
ncbi:predicted protein [Verticillium alfalfae VaMs.102]|uniref:Predicted protein n=1 Tax=Verticillium alfalfae (strain VaMs.102 / ATCC MYA-4576 / FGSC 10136) TaxID=526221 RepID=C9SNT6_VERA1|nr:predicted protein [Verticillium alfalfae VaMs.102]EEY20451.1 predicted protein [Verticillium alfalfae VaMs.102]